MLHLLQQHLLVDHQFVGLRLETLLLDLDRAPVGDVLDVQDDSGARGRLGNDRAGVEAQHAFADARKVVRNLDGLGNALQARDVVEQFVQ